MWGKKKKKLLSGLRKFCYQKTEYVLRQTSFSFAMGKLMFLEMLQDGAGAVEGRVGPWTRDRL